jgi:dihydroxyacetone kinase-like predicted kinase
VYVDLERRFVADDEDRVAEALEPRQVLARVEAAAGDDEVGAVAEAAVLVVGAAEARRLLVVHLRHLGPVAAQAGDDAGEDQHQAVAAGVDDAGLAQHLELLRRALDRLLAVLDRPLQHRREDGVLLLRADPTAEPRAVERTPEQLEVLRESGVVDAGGYGLVLIMAGVVAGLRGDAAAVPTVGHQATPRLNQPHHEDSRFRYCTNFIVSGAGLDSREHLPRLEGLGDSVLVVGDEATLKVHVHTDEPEAAVALFEGVGEVTNLDVADMREQVAERQARLRSGRTGALAVAAGTGFERLFGELGAHVVPGGETLNPSTYELLAGIHEVPADEVLVLPSSANVIMAAERACELSDKPARVVHSTSQQASLLVLVELDHGAPATENAERLDDALEGIASGGVAAAARDDAQGRFRKGDAVGFAAGEIVAWGGTGTTLAATIGRLAEGSEIVTVISGEDAPIPLDEIDTHVPDGVEIETHDGGQPSWWWLLAAQ